MRGTPEYVYYEKHHIVPRSVGGSNDRTNLTLLTAEEHWLVHLLLTRIYPGNTRLVYACQAMTMTGGNNKRTTNKLFGRVRREYAEATSRRQKGRVVSQEQRDNISKALKGRVAPHQLGDNNVSKRPEVAKKISDAKIGRSNGPRSTETKSRISAMKKGKPNLPGHLNPAFKGWIIATPIEDGPVYRMSSKKDMELHGFTKDSVYKCLAGRNKKHKGYTFKREPITVD